MNRGSHVRRLLFLIRQSWQPGSPSIQDHFCSRSHHSTSSCLRFDQEGARLRDSPLGRLFSSQQGSNWKHNELARSLFNKQRCGQPKWTFQGAMRTKYTDARGVRHFKRKGFDAYAFTDGQVSPRLKFLLYATGVGGGLFGIYYITHIEEVPYTHRKHFIAISPESERQLGEAAITDFKKDPTTLILPDVHPYTNRVRQIALPIIEAALSGVPEDNKTILPNGKRWTPSATSAAFTKKLATSRLVKDTKDKEDDPLAFWDSEPAQVEVVIVKEVPESLPPDENVVPLLSNRDELTIKDHELLDDGVHGAPDKGGGGGYLEHLRGLKWEVLVVESKQLNAFCIPGGKVVVYTGLLEQFKQDAELATVLAHEIGHVVARHGAEKISQNIGLSFLQILVVALFNIDPYLVGATTSLIVSLPNSRKLESEADRIGLLLMASAGFDPRVAPAMYQKLSELEQLPSYTEYLSTHPAGHKRALALAKSPTMEEAVKIHQRKVSEEMNEKESLRVFGTTSSLLRGDAPW